MAIFGLSYHAANGADQSNIFLIRNEVCLTGESEDETIREQFRALQPGDLVYLKKYRPRLGLQIRAVGVIVPLADSSDSGRVPERSRLCRSVRWIWYGPVLFLKRFPDAPAVWAEPFYLETHKTVQSQVIELLCSGTSS